ncbi:oxidoreductase domain protein (plasmid) [Gemmatirosa kalamazoonensis]|uniref:Oxidoreductase domain protein n=1 Tax=Gemmatirosa kalamazoonensis TaxID=861299 RepID=W0RQB7_9BACT|nr:Gfo/Idh/MocA family oxidoreductase [Gemmatirosa kalamazoonensis]AHG93179.1 oxidoreductase domain protein [Gemmatirosa kalamazoonensis]
MPLNRKVRYGMVGGGPGAFIGGVHRAAAALDGEIELVAGAFSSSAEKSRQQGDALHLDPARVYASWEEMVERERARAEGDRIDFVTIVTPNVSHFAIAKAFIEAGFHVVCDKPMTTTVEDAEELCRLVKRYDTVFGLTHNYTGYPMVKQARELVRQGKLGTLRKVVAEYPQGWLAKAAGINMWRLDPSVAGISSAVGDIGVHAWHLARYVTGLELTALNADLTSFGKGYELEDDANLLVHYDGGARGVIYSSQISVGEENGLRLRVFGTEAGLDWRQEDPNYLHLLYADRASEVYKRGNDYLAPIARHNTRIPFGHPEGFIEAFANIYRNVARTIAARVAGEAPGEFDTDFPTVQDGARGVHFIHRAIDSGRQRDWVDARYAPPT